jgi:hypothetical protein
MTVKEIDVERNYDKEGNDRVWYRVSGYDWKTNITLDGEYGFIGDAIVNENGETVEGNELLAVEHAMDSYQAASALGSARGGRKAETARENGKRGGRPKKVYESEAFDAYTTSSGNWKIEFHGKYQGSRSGALIVDGEAYVTIEDLVNDVESFGRNLHPSTIVRDNTQEVQ